jgi:hypothetical protein
MPFKSTKFTTFDKDYNKLTPQTKVIVDKIKEEIKKNPLLGENLKANLNRYKSFHFGHKPQYRLLYEFVSKCKKIIKKEKDKIIYECIFPDVVHTKDEVYKCDGLITFCYIKTREECNNLYSYNKKKLK